MKVKAATVRVRANRLHESPTTGGVITKHTGRTRERGILTPANQNVDVKAVLRVNQSEADREVHQHLEHSSLSVYYNCDQFANLDFASPEPFRALLHRTNVTVYGFYG